MPYKDFAKFFGRGVTYSAVEHQFRKWKKAGADLKAEAKNGSTDSATNENSLVAPATSTGRSKATSGRKTSAKKDGVKNGRVEKAPKATAKKNKADKNITVKTELQDEEDANAREDEIIVVSEPQ